MQTADFDVNSFEHQQQQEEDKKLLVKFFVKPRPDEQATLQAGRPIFKDVEYIDIRIPGSRTGGVARPATHRDKQRFAAHYQAFQNRVDVPMEGTPLIEWPLITRSLAEELAFYNVKTVEHLSTMSDTHSGKFMGLNSLKAKAVKWLEQANEEAKVHALQQELLERDERLKLQGNQIEQLQKQMLELMGEKQPAKATDWPSGHQMIPPAAAPEPTPDVDTAPSLHSDLDNPAPVKKARRRRTKTVADNGEIQNSQ